MEIFLIFIVSFCIGFIVYYLGANTKKENQRKESKPLPPPTRVQDIRHLSDKIATIPSSVFCPEKNLSYEERVQISQQAKQSSVTDWSYCVQKLSDGTIVDFLCYGFQSGEEIERSTEFICNTFLEKTGNNLKELYIAYMKHFYPARIVDFDSALKQLEDLEIYEMLAELMRCREIAYKHLEDAE